MGPGAGRGEGGPAEASGMLDTSLLGPHQMVCPPRARGGLTPAPSPLIDAFPLGSGPASTGAWSARPGTALSPNTPHGGAEEAPWHPPWGPDLLGSDADNLSLCLSFPVAQHPGAGGDATAPSPQFHVVLIPGLSGPSSPGAWRGAGVSVLGVQVAVLFFPELRVTRAPHLCKNVPILSPFQLCGPCSRHPGAPLNRPWSLLPAKGPQDSHPLGSLSRAGAELGLRVQGAPWWRLRTLLVQAPVSRSSAGRGGVGVDRGPAQGDAAFFPLGRMSGGGVVIVPGKLLAPECNPAAHIPTSEKPRSWLGFLSPCFWGPDGVPRLWEEDGSWPYFGRGG